MDAERVLQHARKNGCFVEINSSPDRLDLSVTNAHATQNSSSSPAASIRPGARD